MVEAQRTLFSHQELMEAAEQVDPLPASVTRLLTLTNDPNANMTELAEVIRYDPVLTVDVLRRANSAQSAVRDPIIDVSIAVARIGSAEVISLAMSRAMYGRMTVALPAYGMDAHELWQHSLKAALSAEAVAEISSIRIPGHASTAALLHDVGKLVISKVLPVQLAEWLAYKAATDPRPLHEVEQEILGTDHGHVGAIVVRSWDMPMSIQIALTNHHAAPDSPDTLSHVVIASNALALAVPTASQPQGTELDYHAVQSLNHAGVVESRIPLLLEGIEQRFRRVMGSYD